MKKWLCFLGTFICFLFCVLPVRADVIWEPEDAFYEKHSSMCTYVNRCFTANGPEGTVTLYKSPESPKVIDTWENGYAVYISYTYMDSDGILWGIYEGRESKQTGWVPMDYMKVVYDHISFREDYGSEIVDESGDLEEQYREGRVCFWDYPGSKEYYAMNLADWPDLPGYTGVYTDEKGYRWGFVGYYYGRRNFWICLDQPVADYEQLYPDGGPQIGAQAEAADAEYQSPEEQGTERIVPKQDKGTVFLVTGLVALVVIVTAVLLVVLRKAE